MNTVEERRLTKQQIRELATSQLIAEQKCSKHYDSHYSVICYGPDINMLDPCRKWIYDEELAVHGDQDKAQFTANKTVLYINDADLQSKMRELSKSM